MRKAKSGGTLKGHVTVRAAGAKAIERPWNTTVFRLNLYILTGQASEELRDPFITVELEGDELESQECPAVFVHENGDVCNFYRRMTLEIKLPSSSKLLLKMFNKNRFFFRHLNRGSPFGRGGPLLGPAAPARTRARAAGLVAAERGAEDGARGAAAALGPGGA